MREVVLPSASGAVRGIQRASWDAVQSLEASVVSGIESHSSLPSSLWVHRIEFLFKGIESFLRKKRDLLAPEIKTNEKRVWLTRKGPRFDSWRGQEAISDHAYWPEFEFHVKPSIPPNQKGFCLPSFLPSFV